MLGSVVSRGTGFKTASPNNSFKTAPDGGFPGGPVVKTSPSTAGGTGSIPGQGTKIPHGAAKRLLVMLVKG